MYCAQLLRVAPGTIKLYLCGIRHECLVAGQGDVLKNTPHLDACLRGIKKVHASTSRIRLALTTDILCKVGSVLHSKIQIVWKLCCGQCYVQGFTGH